MDRAAAESDERGGVEELPQCSRGLQPAQARAMNWTEMLDAHTLNSARDADTTFGVAYLSRRCCTLIRPSSYYTDFWLSL